MCPCTVLAGIEYISLTRHPLCRLAHLKVLIYLSLIANNDSEKKNEKTDKGQYMMHNERLKIKWRTAARSEL